jgi:hypothetical protein
MSNIRQSVTWTLGAILLFASVGVLGAAEAPQPPTNPRSRSVRSGSGVHFLAMFVITPRLLLPGDPEYPPRCPTGPGNAAAPATGEGIGTHLGVLSETESTCVDFTTLTLSLGEFTLRGANGDEVWGEYEGSASADPPPPNANLFCTWKITGGTGRFADAVGAGDCGESHQLGDGRSLITFDGWIHYAGPN